ncbi:MAG: hypothetical protein OXH98_16245 [Caldilineaceae bacterium]|nr:hypothetical protein [Caldilineaceae bacterium]
MVVMLGDPIRLHADQLVVDFAYRITYNAGSFLPSVPMEHGPMSEEKLKRGALRELQVQFVHDEQGNVRQVIVPIELWSELFEAYQLSSPSADAGQTDAAASPPTMFGAFPELAAIEFGEQFETVKQLGRESIEKQIRRLQGHG